MPLHSHLYRHLHPRVPWFWHTIRLPQPLHFRIVHHLLGHFSLVEMPQQAPSASSEWSPSIAIAQVCHSSRDIGIPPGGRMACTPLDLHRRVHTWWSITRALHKGGGGNKDDFNNSSGNFGGDQLHIHGFDVYVTQCWATTIRPITRWCFVQEFYPRMSLIILIFCLGGEDRKRNLSLQKNCTINCCCTVISLCTSTPSREWP